MAAIEDIVHSSLIHSQQRVSTQSMAASWVILPWMKADFPDSPFRWHYTGEYSVSWKRSPCQDSSQALGHSFITECRSHWHWHPRWRLPSCQFTPWHHSTLLVSGFLVTTSPSLVHPHRSQSSWLKCYSGLVNDQPGLHRGMRSPTSS